MTPTFRAPRNTVDVEFESAFGANTPPAKAAFYNRLREAWNRGQEAILQEWGERCVPYDLVLAGIAGIVRTANPDQYGDCDILLADETWGDLARKLPTNSDPIVVYFEMRRQYPFDFVNIGKRGNNGSDKISRGGVR